MGNWSDALAERWAENGRAKAEEARRIAEEAAGRAAAAVADRGAKELDAADMRAKRLGAYFEGTDGYDEAELTARTRSILNTTADSYELAGEDRVRGTVFSVAATRSRIADLQTDLRLGQPEAVRSMARLVGLLEVDTGYEDAPTGDEAIRAVRETKPMRIPTALVAVAALGVFMLELLPTKWFLTNRLTLASGSDSDLLVWLVSTVIAAVLTGAMVGAGRLWAASKADRSKRGAAWGFAIVAVSLQALSFGMRVSTESEESGAKGALIAIALVAFCGGMLLMFLEYLATTPAPVETPAAAHTGTHHRVVDNKVVATFNEMQKTVHVHLPSAMRDTQLARTLFDEEELIRLSGAARGYGAVHEKVVNNMLNEVRAAKAKLEQQDMGFDPIFLEDEAEARYGRRNPLADENPKVPATGPLTPRRPSETSVSANRLS